MLCHQGHNEYGDALDINQYTNLRYARDQDEIRSLAGDAPALEAIDRLRAMLQQAENISHDIHDMIDKNFRSNFHTQVIHGLLNVQATLDRFIEDISTSP